MTDSSTGAGAEDTPASDSMVCLVGCGHAIFREDSGTPSSVLMVAGCAATTVPEFQAEQTDRDVISDATAHSDIDADSTRHVGEVEGTALYLARGENDTTCVIQMRDEEWGTTACGAGQGLGTELASGTLIEVGTFTFEESKVDGRERTKLSESVSVIPSS